MHFRSKHENIIQMQNNFFNVFSSKREVNMHKKKKTTTLFKQFVSKNSIWVLVFITPVELYIH